MIDAILKYTPYELLGILKKYRVEGDGNQNLKISILGKYLYYIKNGNFPNTFEGRKKIAKQISIDLKKQNIATVPENDIFSVITSAKVFTDFDNKKPIEERGPLTKIGSVNRGVKFAYGEIADKLSRGAGAVKSGLDPTKIIPSPSGIYQKIGLATVTAFILFIMYKKIAGGRK